MATGTEVIKANGGVVTTATQLTAETIEKVLVQGNLAGLNAAERMSYYKAVCESVGLNPLTRPFDYITLNGKLTLYAKRDCTDQLRAIHNVTSSIVSRDIFDGVYVVVARAQMPNGRQDESTGAVAIDGLKGEARANAMMKAETKAKRRATLSLCGLSFMDQDEVESALGAAVQAASFNPMDTSAPALPAPTAPVQPAPDTADASIKARLKQFADMKAKIGKERYYRILGNHGYEHANEIKRLESARNVYKEMVMIEREMIQPSDAEVQQ